MVHSKIFIEIERNYNQNPFNLVAILMENLLSKYSKCKNKDTQFVVLLKLTAQKRNSMKSWFDEKPRYDT